MADIIVAGNTSGAITISAPLVAGSGVLTLPTGTDTLVGKATTDTLTNKSIAATQLTGTIAAAALPAGSVLQVVNATYSTSVTIASTVFAATGLTASITPTSATSKIIVFINQIVLIYRQYGATQSGDIKLYRGASQLALYEAISQWVGTNTTIDVRMGGSFSTVYVDSPNTTSSTTYSTQAACSVTAQSGYVAVNGSPSTITLMEIAV